MGGGVGELPLPPSRPLPCFLPPPALSPRPTPLALSRLLLALSRSFSLAHIHITTSSNPLFTLQSFPPPPPPPSRRGEVAFVDFAADAHGEHGLLGGGGAAAVVQGRPRQSQQGASLSGRAGGERRSQGRKQGGLGEAGGAEATCGGSGGRRGLRHHRAVPLVCDSCCATLLDRPRTAIFASSVAPSRRQRPHGGACHGPPGATRTPKQKRADRAPRPLPRRPPWFLARTTVWGWSNEGHEQGTRRGDHGPDKRRGPPPPPSAPRPPQSRCCLRVF